MKTWYLFVKNNGRWFFYTSVNAHSAKDAYWKEFNWFFRAYPMGHLRAFSNNRLPWEK